MAKKSGDVAAAGLSKVVEALPTDRLAEQARGLVVALAERAVARTAERVGGAVSSLGDYAERGGGPREQDGSGGGGGGGGGKSVKATNIVEAIEVGVPVRVAYNQWTQFQDFSQYMSKVESVQQESDEKLNWKAGIFLSHRTWESTIVEQIPDQVIVWRSTADKGSADGTVTFHQVAPNLTKILLVLEYHPQGLFERTGNLWRAQGRRVRLELKQFRRHVMTRTILDPDAVEGWRGEIRDGEVVKSHEEALEEEQGAEDTAEDSSEAEDSPEAAEEEAPEDEGEEPEDEYEDDEDEEPEDEEPEDEEPEFDDEESYEDDEDVEEEPAPRSRRQPAKARGR